MVASTLHAGKSDPQMEKMAIPIRKKKKWQNCRKFGAYALFVERQIVKACKILSSFLKHAKRDMLLSSRILISGYIFKTLKSGS